MQEKLFRIVVRIKNYPIDRTFIVMAETDIQAENMLLTEMYGSSLAILGVYDEDKKVFIIS